MITCYYNRCIEKPKLQRLLVIKCRKSQSPKTSGNQMSEVPKSEDFWLSNVGSPKVLRLLVIKCRKSQSPKTSGYQIHEPKINETLVIKPVSPKVTRLLVIELGSPKVMIRLVLVMKRVCILRNRKSKASLLL